MCAVSAYTSASYFPPSLLSAPKVLYFVQMSDVAEPESADYLLHLLRIL